MPPRDHRVHLQHALQMPPAHRFTYMLQGLQLHRGPITVFIVNFMLPLEHNSSINFGLGSP